MESYINLGLQGELASFLISSARLLCPSDQDFVDYRGKLESIMEPSSVPTFGFSLSVFIFSWKPPDQGSVGCSPERILPDKKNHEACPKILQYKTECAFTESNIICFPRRSSRVQDTTFLPIRNSDSGCSRFMNVFIGCKNRFHVLCPMCCVRF